MLRLREYILPVLYAFALGGVVGVYASYPITLGVVLSMLGLILLVRALRGQYPLTMIIITAIIGCGVGIFRGAAYAETYRCGMLCAKVGIYTEFTGQVVDEPSTLGGGQRFYFKPNAYEGEGTLLVSSGRYPEVAYGDIIHIGGVAKLPEVIESERGADFRYDDFLRARGSILLFRAKSLRVVEPRKGNAIVTKLLDLKGKIANVVKRLPSPESGLLMGMIFGGKNGLPNDVQDDFRVAGLIHLVVLSGQNLAIIAALVTLFIRRLLGFISGTFVSLGVVLAYAIIGGMQPATMRALCFIALVLLSILLKREAHPPRLFFVTLSILLVLDPYMLLDDPSFQLSALAVAGLFFIGPIVERILLARHYPVLVVTYLAPLFGAQLAVLPYLVWSTGQLALYAFPANLVVLLFVGALSIGGLFVVGVGLFFGAVFSLVALPVTAMLSAVLFVAHFFAHLPFASIPFALSATAMLAVYAFIAVYLFFRWRHLDMTPLARYALREEVKALRNKKIPWTPPLPEEHGITLMGSTCSFVFEKTNSHTREDVIDWSE